MLTLIKRTEPWEADASGHVLSEQFFREFKWKGATVAVMSTAQLEGWFGNPPTDPEIDGVKVVHDSSLPKDQIHFYDGEKLVGRIRNLYAKSIEEAST